jgi:hydroxypyruvate reductase 1
MSSAGGVPVEVHNPGGALRVLVTKTLPGDRWLKVLTASGCRVEVCSDPDTILSNDKIKKLIGNKCDGVIGQLTEVRRLHRSPPTQSTIPEPKQGLQ